MSLQRPFQPRHLTQISDSGGEGSMRSALLVVGALRFFDAWRWENVGGMEVTMTRARRSNRFLGLVMLAMLYAGLGNAQVFGPQDYNVITIPAVTFAGGTFHISGSVGRYGDTNADQHFYAPLEVPTGAIIDYIGLNNLNDGTPSAITVTILDRYADGS